MKIKYTLLTLCLLGLFLFPACSSDSGSTAAPVVSRPSPTEERIPVEGDSIAPSDYADPNNWMAAAEAEMPVDVFVLYPTAYSAGEGEKKISSVNDAGMRAGARDFLQTKASALSTAGNMFAPYYRQLDAVWLLSLPADQQSQYIKGVPKTDVLAAFDYYIRHYNNGRPFILFSHSQGSSMSKEILFDYLKKHPEVNRRMIAAYVIGYSVTDAELEANPHVKFAENADDTGVIISYNTEAPQIGGESPVRLPGSVAINPVNWKRDETYAPASENLGSRINGNGGYEKIDGLADARVDTGRGVVICAGVDRETYSMPREMRAVFPAGVYHGYDIPFYYYNLRQNAENRRDNFLQRNPRYAR